MLPVNRVLSILLCLNLAAMAQQHYNAWFRSSLSIPVSKTIRTELEIQHRRQNGPGNTNILDKNLMFNARSWFHYQHKETVKFSVSPFAYFMHYKSIQKQGDERSPPAREFRISVAAELHYKIRGSFILLFYRPVIEMRFPEPPPSYLIRLRNRLGSGYAISSNLKVMVYDELFFHIAGNGLKHLFDQNRSCLSVEYKALPGIKLEAGYICVLRQPMPRDKFIHENNFFVNFTCLLQKQESK